VDQVTVNDGVRIAWEERGPSDDPVPVVLVHGLGYARWGWEPVVDRLAATRRVVLIDNRGIGASDVPEGPYTAAQMAGDVLAVVDDLGVDRVQLVGVSLGGMVVQHAALARPAQVDRVVLVSTTPGGEVARPIPPATLALIGRMPSMDPVEALHAAVDNALGDVGGDARDALVDRIVHHRTSAPQDPAGWQAQAHAGTTHALGEGVAAIDCPVLVLHGDRDAVVDVGNAEVLGRLLPDAEVHVVPGGGHLWFWEQPDVLVDRVTAFLA
jgi:3-oxoadipate enol-lactonase